MYDFIKCFSSLVIVVVALVGYVYAADAPAAPKAFEKFTVYQDKPSRNHYVPSGFIPNGKCVAIDDAWQQDCQEGRSCIKASFDRDCATRNMIWAGIFWLDPANNWGDQKGGFDLTGATKLTFWAKGEKGGEVLVFKMGGVGLAEKYPDTDAASTEPITLTNQWQQYSIDLTGKNLKHITGGFCWVGSAKDNPSNINFYLDSIYYE